MSEQISKPDLYTSSMLDDPRVLEHAEAYAKNQPEPHDFEEATELGREATAHGISEVYGSVAAIGYLASGAI